jgi:hypothetical protein
MRTTMKLTASSRVRSERRICRYRRFAFNEYFSRHAIFEPPPKRDDIDAVLVFGWATCSFVDGSEKLHSRRQIAQLTKSTALRLAAMRSREASCGLEATMTLCTETGTAGGFDDAGLSFQHRLVLRQPR